MSQKVTLDPLTRIEGHLAVRLSVDDGKVSSAQCSGEMFRGFEQILQGRSPLDAQQIIQRICGVCPVSHGLASVFAQEAAYGISVPQNGHLIRNIILASNYINSHITHFYHLSALDFVDVSEVLNYQGKDSLLLNIKSWAQDEFASTTLFPAAPFLPQYAGTYLQSTELNLGVLKNYFVALEMRALSHQLISLFGGKMPHVASLVPGGVTEKVDAKKIAASHAKLQKLENFIRTSYKQDVLAVASEFSEYFSSGKGYDNYLAFEAFKENGPSSSPLFPEGVLTGGNLESLSVSAIEERVAYSRYTDTSNRHITIPDAEKKDAYSWIKAPRYNGLPMEVGPLARILIAYKQKDPATLTAVNSFLATTGRSLDDLNSCMGRHVARYLELEIVVKKCGEWIAALNPNEPTAHPFNIPRSAQGEGLVEAPRGALGHWIEIKNHKISRYECIVPTTWNCSPKDDAETFGPMEYALKGTAIADADNPIEAARIIRSFDPCLACAVH